MTDHPNYTEEVQKKWQKMAIYYAMITGEGYGTVRNIPFYRDPLVRYKLTSKDLKNLSEALQKLALLLFEADAKILYPSISNSFPLTHPQDLAKIPEELPKKQTNLMTVHVFSSCPMGENLQKCAVNSFGKVHGFNNLYIADGSILCSAPGVNPQGSIMAIARRNVLNFLQG